VIDDSELTMDELFLCTREGGDFGVSDVAETIFLMGLQPFVNILIIRSVSLCY